MKRPLLAAAVLAAVGIGIIDPYACVQHSKGGSITREIPKSDRARLIERARRALALVPAPGPGYARDTGTATVEADASASWSDASRTWLAPGTARAERIHEPQDPDRADAPPSLEVRIFINSETGLPMGLASVGGDPAPFALKGAAAVEVTMAGAETAGVTTPAPAEEAPAGGDPPGEEAPRGEGRVALPLSPAQARNALTIVRIVVGDRAAEETLLAMARGEVRSPAAVSPSPATSAAHVGSITVEIYGGQKDVETLARRVPAAAIRKLLDARTAK